MCSVDTASVGRAYGNVLTIVAIWALFAGCSTTDVSDGNVGRELPTAGSGELVTLAVPRRGLSAVGDDYLFMGPVSLNRNGRAQSYLWLALATTIDRQVSGADQPTLKRIIIRVDGVPMTFDLEPWNESIDNAPFDTPLRAQAAFRSRVTASQLEKLGDAAVLDAYVTDQDNRSPLYTVVK